jgi:hypothetical protein
MVIYREELKQWAAVRRVLYDSETIPKAFPVAEAAAAPKAFLQPNLRVRKYAVS